MDNRKQSGWMVAIIAIEIFLFARYQAHDARIHFFLHSLAAITFVFIIAAIVSLLDRKPRGLLYAAFLLHQYAMFPDYLYSLGYPHRPWMNLFLGHLWLDDLVYHEVILPAVALIAVIGYFLVKKISSKAKYHLIK